MDVIKAYSATVAAGEAIEQAAVTGLGLIKRTQDGFYICVPSNEFEIRVKEPAPEKPSDDVLLCDQNVEDLRFVSITDVDRYIVITGVRGGDAHSEEMLPKEFNRTTENMERADVVRIVTQNGSVYTIKDRYGPNVNARVG